MAVLTRKIGQFFSGLCQFMLHKNEILTMHLKQMLYKMNEIQLEAICTR